MKQTYRSFWVILLCTLVFVGIFTGCRQMSDGPVKRIAVIYPLEEGDWGQNSCAEILADRLSGTYRVDIKEFFLQCRAKEDVKQRVDRLDSLIREACRWKADAVVLRTDLVTNTFLRSELPERDSLSVLFSGVIYPDSVQVRQRPRLKGVVASYDIGKNLKLMDICLQAKVVGLTTDSTQMGQKINTRLKKVLRKGAYTLLSDTCDHVQSLKKALGQKETVVMDIPFYKISGKDLMALLDHFTMENDCAYLNLSFTVMSNSFCQMPNCPIFTATAEGFNLGNKVFVGGYFSRDEEDLSMVATMLKELFEGRWDKVPVLNHVEATYQFDYKILKLWGIAEKDLPAGSIIVRQPWVVKYSLYLWITGILFVVLVCFILFRIIRNHRNVRKETLHTRRIAEELRHLMLSISGAKAAVWSYSDNEYVLDENLQQLLGIRRSKLSKEEFFEFIHPDDRPVLKDRTFRDAMQTCVLVYRLLNRNTGEYRWMKSRFRAEMLADGRYRMAGVLTDYQEQKKYENSLRAAKQLAEKAELKQAFLANMSHEIRNPLNTIVGFSNLLSSEDAKDLPYEVRKQYMEVITNNSDLLQRLLDSIMDISSIETGAMDFIMNDYAVDRLVGEIYRAYSVVVRKDVEFLVEYPKEKMMVHVDKLRFIQVMDNFLSNSNKFTKKGFIKVGSRYDEAHNEVRVYVQDTGIGITEENQTKIFQRFFKCEEQAVGTGLGLPLCSLIAQKMNARIEVESVYGEGSTFSLVLPCVRKEVIHED